LSFSTFTKQIKKSTFRYWLFTILNTSSN